MQYMCLLYASEANEPKPGTKEFDEYLNEFFEFSQKVEQDGVFVSGEGLQPVSTATTVSTMSGKVETMDGPFAETKEVLGGFYILDCKDLDQAIEYAAQIPSAKYGRVEVRPVMVYDEA